MMLGNGGCAHVVAMSGIRPRWDGRNSQFRRRGNRGRKVGGERQRLVEMDVDHLERIIWGHRIRKVDRRGLRARRLQGIVREAGRAELRGRRWCGPRSQPVLHRIWLRRRSPIEMGGQAGLDAHLFRGQARSVPQEFEGVHAWGRVRQRERFGQTGRDHPFGFDAIRQLGPRDQGAFERK